LILAVEGGMKKSVMAIFLMLFLCSCGKKKEEAILGYWKLENGYATLNFFSDNTVKDSNYESESKWVILDDGRVKVTNTREGGIRVYNKLEFSEDNDTMTLGYRTWKRVK